MLTNKLFSSYLYQRKYLCKFQNYRNYFVYDTTVNVNTHEYPVDICAYFLKMSVLWSWEKNIRVIQKLLYLLKGSTKTLTRLNYFMTSRNKKHHIKKSCPWRFLLVVSSAVKVTKFSCHDYTHQSISILYRRTEEF